MDLSRGVGYRGFQLNSTNFDLETHDLFGCTISTVEYGSVIGAGYDEKRAMDEGRDASDVYLDQRFISLAGTIYGRSRQEAFDHYAKFSEVMSPSAAYQADPSHRGYHALDFWRPTDSDAFSGHLIHQALLARPMATPSARFARTQGSQPDEDLNPRDGDALAIPWTAQLVAKDPRIVGSEAIRTSVAGHHVTSGVKPTGSGTIRNRGTVPAVIDVYLRIPPKINGGTSPGKFNLHIDGHWEVDFTLPVNEAETLLRYSTDQKVVAYGYPGKRLGLRMDLFKLVSGTAHKHLTPRVDPYGYDWTLTRQSTKTLRSESYFQFRDTWV